MYHAMLVSGIQESDSALYICMYIYNNIYIYLHSFSDSFPI